MKTMILDDLPAWYEYKESFNEEYGWGEPKDYQRM